MSIFEQNGQLAQLVEHPLHVRRVKGSSPLLSTRCKLKEDLKLQYNHESVLKVEAVKGLLVRPGEVYLDATGGAGGHSGLILDQLLGSGLLIILDRDPDACEFLQEKFRSRNNVKIVRSNFRELKQVLDKMQLPKVSGVLMDLGVSSHQIDCVTRGFSYRQDSKLDMRMEKRGMLAEEVVNTYPIEELTRIFWEYGEEQFAKRIAERIGLARSQATITRSSELVAIVEEAVPKRKWAGRHPARRIFQALRIEVNDELEALRQGLQAAFEKLASKGRMSVISFHSLEDRLVKHKFREFVGGCSCPPRCPVCLCGGRVGARLVQNKAVTPSEEEQLRNKRARSAKLRVIEKL